VFSALESVGQGIVQLHDDSNNPPWEYAVYRDINPPGGFHGSPCGITVFCDLGRDTGGTRVFNQISIPGDGPQFR
jgi:hypothetical protein